MQTQKVTSFPIVLMGSSYWGGLVDWLRDTVLAGGKISPPDIDILTVSDDVEEAVAIMVAARDEHTRGPGSGQKHPAPKQPE